MEEPTTRSEGSVRRDEKADEAGSRASAGGLLLAVPAGCGREAGWIPEQLPQHDPGEQVNLDQCGFQMWLPTPGMCLMVSGGERDESESSPHSSTTHLQSLVEPSAEWIPCDSLQSDPVFHL